MALTGQSGGGWLRCPFSQLRRATHFTKELQSRPFISERVPKMTQWLALWGGLESCPRVKICIWMELGETVRETTATQRLWTRASSVDQTELRKRWFQLEKRGWPKPGLVPSNEGKQRNLLNGWELTVEKKTPKNYPRIGL